MSVENPNERYARACLKRSAQGATPTLLIPLQHYSYHLTLARGTNPDAFRLKDLRFAQAMKLVQL